jgi:site-specific DNA-methyltransferase (adenine-specific)
MKKYQVIYTDPPWSYNDKMIGHGGAESEYITQDLAWIKALPIKELGGADSTLFLWAVSPMLPEAIEVMRAWGYEYKTIAFCWSKQSKNSWVSNLGKWTMGNIELCLLGVRGHPQRIRKDIKQLVIAERTIHSKKPDEVRNRIVQLMGDVPRIELFCRGDKEKDMFGYNRLEGWDVFGNEVENSIELYKKE